MVVVEVGMDEARDHRPRHPHRIAAAKGGMASIQDEADGG